MSPREELRMRLDDIKTRWLEEASRTIAQLIRAFPKEGIYAAAFHLFHADYSKILSPALAANAESAVVVHSDKTGAAWSTRWAPPEWRWDVLDAASDALTPDYEKLSQALQGVGDAEWAKLIEMHDGVIADVARTITATARNRDGEFRDIAVSKDFVVAILEGQRETSEYNRLVRASIDPAILLNLEGILHKASSATDF